MAFAAAIVHLEGRAQTQLYLIQTTVDVHIRPSAFRY